MTDISNNKMYAVKVIPQSRVLKPHQREKVRARNMSAAGQNFGWGGGGRIFYLFFFCQADNERDRAPQNPVAQARSEVLPPLRRSREHLHLPGALQSEGGSHQFILSAAASNVFPCVCVTRQLTPYCLCSPWLTFGKRGTRSRNQKSDITSDRSSPASSTSTAEASCTETSN